LGFGRWRLSCRRNQVEAGSQEVVVDGERLGDAALLHYGEAHGVDQAEVLVSVASEDRLRLLLEGGVRIDLEQAGALAERPQKLHGCLMPGVATDEDVGFGDDQVTGDEDHPIGQQEPVFLCRSAVMLVPPIAQADPGAGIDEDFPRH